MNEIELGGPLLRGECNRCGACCVVHRDGVRYDCDYLVRMAPIGTPRSSLCLVYDARYHHMPITLTNALGDTIAGKCAASDTPEETASIIANGIGRGFCSLEVVA